MFNFKIVCIDDLAQIIVENKLLFT